MSPLITALTYVYPIICVFAPCIVYQIILYRKGNKNETINKGNLILRYLFIFYLFAVLNIVGLGTIWEIGNYGEIIRLDEIHLIPFQSEGLFTYVMNVIMFAPLGFALPFLWEKYRSFPKAIFTGFLFSLSIEIGQLFNRRQTDIDDLMMNVLGTILGFCIWLLLGKRFKTKPRELYVFKDEPLMYLCLSVLGIFLLHDWRWYFSFMS